MGRLQAVITQNVDNLHQEGGSRNVIEFHGNARRFVCLRCSRAFDPKTLDFSQLPLYCPCGGLIKPDIVFFGEEIPVTANQASFELAETCDLMLVIGASAAVMPANYLHCQKTRRLHRRDQSGDHRTHPPPHRLLF